MPTHAFSKSQKKTTKSNSKNIAMMDYILERTKRFNPTLRSLTMVEKLVCENKEFDSKGSLYRKLPTGMQYPVFSFILDILQKQDKIMIDNGAIFWVGQSSPKLQQSLEKAVKY